MPESPALPRPGTYSSLGCPSVKESLEAIRAYPIQPKPEIFGLHENADITCDQNETYDMFVTVLSLQPRIASGKGKSQDEVRRLHGMCVRVRL